VAPISNYALIDHWTDGVARREIAAGGWGWVVLQQGWTPSGVYRDTLRLATRNFAAEIAKVGAKVALYQTWPPANQPGEFAGSIESYEMAAADVGGVVFPVARAWLAAWARDPSITLYSDGLHVGGRFVSRRARDVCPDPGPYPGWPARGDPYRVRGHHASRAGGCSNPARRGRVGDARSKRAVVSVQRARSGTDG